MASESQHDAGLLGCPIAGRCGGCALIERPYAEQLRLKTNRVREAFRGVFGADSPPVEECLPAPRQSHYRNRAKLAVGFQSGELRLGLYERGSARIVDLAPCRVQEPALTEALRRLRGWIGRYRLAAPAGPLFYVDLRRLSGDRIHLTLVLSRPARDLPLAALSSGWDVLAGVAVNHGDPKSSYGMGAESRVMVGEPLLALELPRQQGSLELMVRPGGFFQVGPAALEEVHRRAGRHLGENGTLYDLYCGAGVHGIVLAAGGRVIGVESDGQAVSAARHNAELHGVAASYVKADVEERLPSLLATAVPSRVVLNPGRSGCREGVVEALAEARVPRWAYLSCSPGTLARDLARASAGGMRIVSVTPVDLMPQTDQVEVLACLETLAEE